MSLWDDMLSASAVNPFLPTGMLAQALGPLLSAQQAKPNDLLQGYLADPYARSDIDLQQRARAGPPSIGQSLTDLSDFVGPYLTGGGGSGSATLGSGLTLPGARSLLSDPGSIAAAQKAGDLGQGTGFFSGVEGGGGLLGNPTPAGFMDRIRRLVNRDPDAGQPKNAAVELEPGIFVGNGTHDQWLARTQKVLTPDEIAEARRWYSDAASAYGQHFGPELGPDMMGAWLTGNVNASPSFAQLSALRTREQLINQTGLISEQKRGGLADEALRDYWQARGVGNNMSAMGGTAGGQKIYDFIDSAKGSPTRTFYGHDPAAGAPFVADVHSLRDMGMVDGPLQNWVEQKYGPDAAAGLQLDTAGQGGAKEAPYEWAANKGRDLTDWLNQQGFMGGEWTPAEVQAVGWKTMAKMTGRAGETPEQAILAHQRPMSYELDPGQGSPFENWFQQLGWHNLSPEDQAAVTHNVMGPILDFAKQQTGAIETNRLQGLGGWNNAGQATLAPANRSYINSSPEVFGDMADMVGYLANQTKVLGMRPLNSGGKLALAIHHPDLADPANIQAMWDGLVQNHPDFAAGFSPAIHADGTPGMEMLFDKGGVGMSNRLQSELIPGIEDIANDIGLSGPDLRARVFKAEDLSREHDWTQDPTAGTGYLRRLGARYGPDLLQRMEDFKNQTLHPLIEREITSRQPKAGAAQVAPQGVGPPPGLLNTP